MNNKIFRILTVVLLFGFLAVSKNSVGALETEKIIEKLMIERRDSLEKYFERKGKSPIPDSKPGSRYCSIPGSKPGSRHGSKPDPKPDSKSDSKPGSKPDSKPDSKPGSKSDLMLDPNFYLKFNNKDFFKEVSEIESSYEFKIWESEHVKERHDNILLVFLFKYIYENSSKFFGKEGEEFKRVLIPKILSMRSNEERRGDKFVAGKMEEDVKSSLIRYYGYLVKRSV